MRKWLFFSSFMKPGKEWGWNECSVGGWRSFCWWLVELLFVTGGASVGEKTKPSFGGDSKVLFVVKKRSFLPNALWNAFFLSVNSCMIGSYLRFEKK